MNEEQRQLLDDLRQIGVPEPMVEQLEFLLQEIGGVLVAEGWSDPAGQARFVAERLECHAAAFRDQAAIYLVRIGAHRG